MSVNPTSSVRTGASARGADPYAFLEVDSKDTSAEFKAYMRSALHLLATSKTDIGRETFRVISQGKVRLDELTDLTKKDYLHLLKEFAKEGQHFARKGYPLVRDGRSAVARAIQHSMSGYMWDNRVYVARGMSAELLARTLVHEVNHVMNESEEHYRTPKQAFLEEYRAHLAEQFFLGKDPTADERRKLKQQILRDYGWPELSPTDVPDDPPGVMIPRVG